MNELLYNISKNERPLIWLQLIDFCKQRDDHFSTCPTLMDHMRHSDPKRLKSPLSDFDENWFEWY